MHNPRASDTKPKITPPETEKIRVSDAAARIFVGSDRYNGQTKAIEARNDRA